MTSGGYGDERGYDRSAYRFCRDGNRQLFGCCSQREADELPDGAAGKEGRQAQQFQQQRIPVMEEQIKVANHRIEDLEREKA